MQSAVKKGFSILNPLKVCARIGFFVVSIVLSAGWFTGCNKPAPPPLPKAAGPAAGAATPAADENAERHPVEQHEMDQNPLHSIGGG